MKAFFVTTPGDGHLNPALAVAEKLVERGHKVSFASADSADTRVRDAGARPVEYASTLPRRRLPPLAPAELLRRTYRLVTDETISVTEQLEADVRRHSPDVIVYDGPMLTGRLLSLGVGVPSVKLVPTLHPANEGHESVRLIDFVETYAGATSERASSFLLDRGLSDMTLTEAFAEVGAPKVNFIPEAFAPRVGEDDVFVGPCVTTSRLRERAADTGTTRPTVLVSMGTVFNNDIEPFRLCCAALAQLGWPAVVVTGGGIDVRDLGPVPQGTVVRDYVAQIAVLEVCAVFVCHGGLVSIMESLSLGVPVVVIPQGPEQERNGARVEELGLGRCVRPGGVTGKGLADVIRAVADSRGTRRRVDEMRALICASGGPEAAATVVENVITPRSPDDD